jgi:hypothetical protein
MIRFSSLQTEECEFIFSGGPSELLSEAHPKVQAEQPQVDTLKQEKQIIRFNLSKFREGYMAGPEVHPSMPRKAFRRPGVFSELRLATKLSRKFRWPIR